MKTKEEIDIEVANFKKRLEDDNEMELFEQLGAQEYILQKNIESGLKLNAFLKSYDQPTVKYTV